METIIINIMNDFGYIGIFFLILVENIFPPIPSELILTFGGFMTKSTSMSIWGVIIVSTLGSLAGAILLYYIGKILNKERLKKIVSSKAGKILCLKANDIEKADHWFDNKGNISVFFCRFIPVVRSLISIPAGMSEMPIFKFIIFTIFGSLIWNSVLSLLGLYAHSKIDIILDIINKFSYVIVILLIILVISFVYYLVKRRRKR